MKRIIKASLVAASLAALILGAASCGMKKSVEITSVGWVIENIDRNFWSNPPSSNRLGIRFYVNYSCIGCDDSDLRSLLVTAPDGTYWDIALDSSDIDAEDDYVTVSLVDNRDNYTTMMLGEYEFELEVDGGGKGLSSLNVPAPGSTSSSGKTRVYSENFTGTVTSSYAATVRRGVFGGVFTIDTDSLSFTFSTTSALCFSGWVYLYDESGTYIGRTPPFRAYDTDAVADFLNGGTHAVYTDGTANAVDIAFDQMVFLSGYSAADLGQIALVLTDGAQYMGSPSTYDCMSLTAREIF